MKANDDKLNEEVLQLTREVEQLQEALEHKESELKKKEADNASKTSEISQLKESLTAQISVLSDVENANLPIEDQDLKSYSEQLIKRIVETH